jgi:hypothetical protein
MSALAELSSLSTVLDELAQRVTSLVDGLSGAERDELSSDLREVERALGTAQRRLHRLLDTHR